MKRKSHIALKSNFKIRDASSELDSSEKCEKFEHLDQHDAETQRALFKTKMLEQSKKPRNDQGQTVSSVLDLDIN